MLNKCIFIGRVTKAPELIYTQDRIARCTFFVAVQDSQTKETNYVPCVAWRGYAETLANQLHTGKLISVESRFTSKNYMDRGRPAVFYEFEVEHVRFLD